MVVLLAAHYLTRTSGVLLFWLAFILTRPLGATAGDLLSKPAAKGGLGLGTWGTSAALLAIVVVGVVYSGIQLRKRAVTPDSPAPELDNA
ncbi:MAG: hypothetical protein J2P18_04980, partial [Nocardia sp.]|nr:hypothetical protein [Nocardia sp.]